MPTITPDTFAAWRAQRAGLGAGPLDTDRAPALERAVQCSGWVLSPGSTAPYVALRTRHEGCSREVVDRAIYRDRELIRVTGVRGEPFLVPRNEVVTAVAAKGRRIDARIRQINKAVPISRGEVETLAMAIAEFLEAGPASFQDLEEGLPAGMLRSFGTEGRRAGVPGVLPVGLEFLEEEGRILLLDDGCRLDDGQRRYHLTGQVLPDVNGAVPDQLEVLPEVLRIYLATFGPARLEDFVWWAGTTLNRARTAAAALEEAPVEFRIDGVEDPFLALPEDLSALQGHEPAEAARVSLVPNRDPYYLGQKALAEQYLPAENTERVLARCRGKPVPSSVLPTVLKNGRIIGIWEWDEGRKEVRWALFEADTPDVESAVEREAAWLTTFIRDELEGTFVLDPVERGPYWTYGIDEIREFW